MGLLDKAAERRGELLQKLTQKKEKYIKHISKARKKAIYEGIKKQRKVFEKLKIEAEKSALKPVENKIDRAKNVTLPPVKVVPPVRSVVPLVKSVSSAKPVVPSVKSVSPVEIVHPKSKRKPVKSVGKIDLSSIKAQIEKKMKPEGAADVTHFQESFVQPLKSVKDITISTKGGAREFLKTGIPGFDDLFEHGIPKGNTVIVAGGTGSGKTIFCLQTLFNRALRGEKCLYMSFEESEDHLKQHLLDFGWDPEKVKKNLMIKRFSSFDVTRSVDALLMKEKGELLIDVEPVIFPSGFKPSFIVVDSLTAIASAFTGKEDSYRIYIEQLFRFFEKKNVTSLLITETKQIPEIFSASGVEEFLADGVIVLYAIKRGNIRENAIEVLKMRGEHHQKKIVAMQISDKGITVFPEQEVFGEMESK